MKYLFILSAILYFLPLRGQDSSRRMNSIKELTKDIRNNLYVTQKRTHDSVFFQKSELGFRLYAGKVIRNTIVHKLKFGESVLDTSIAVFNTISSVANNLLTGTKPFIIRQLLFVKPGQIVDPFQLADNERFLRTLDFIKDARIRISPIPDCPDSVDIVVVVRDVFSIGVRANVSGINDFSASLYDANLFGRAQLLKYTVLYDRQRKPKMGSEILFRKYNIWGSFVNVEGSYTTIDKGISLGNENETSTNIKISRPLYSSNAQLAGGLNLNWNHSANKYERPDSNFHNYRYRLGDVWFGYNIGAQTTKYFSEYREDTRKRKFIAVRYFDQHFFLKPNFKPYNYLFTNKRYIIGELTWYKLNFYRTNYIYGFGRTEDIPEGYARKIIVGHTQIDSLQRMYLGYEYNHWLVDRNENYYNYTLGLGTNHYHQTFQDNSLFFNFSWTSRLFSFEKIRLRQLANISYAGISNFKAYDQLRINNEYGLEQFNTDSAVGIQRLTMGVETAIFTRWQLLGFKIGFFAFGKLTLLTPREKALFQGNFYPAIGGGFRTRNENLIFGTIEGKINWFPRTIQNVNQITLSLKGNIRLKFSESFVQAPWFAALK